MPGGEAERRRGGGGALDFVASIASASSTSLLGGPPSSSSSSALSPAAGGARSSSPASNNNPNSKKGKGPLSFLLSKVTALPLGALVREAWRRRRRTVELSGGAAKAIAKRASTAARALAAATGITLVSWVFPATWGCVDLLAVVALVPFGAGASKTGGAGAEGSRQLLRLPPRGLSPVFALASRAGRALAPAALARTLGGAALAAAAPDTARTLRMWGQFLPVYLRYRWTKHHFSCEPRGSASGRLPWCGGQRWPEVEEAWDRRHEWGAPKVHGMLSSLSGYYVKAAQILASRGDFVPKQWVPLLSRMFDSMDPRPWNEVKRDIEAGLDASPAGGAARARAEAAAEDEDEEERSRQPRLLVRFVPFARPVGRWLRHRRARRVRIHLDEVFLRVNDRPLATASIAQVHCAQLDSSFRASLGWRWPAASGLGPSVVLKVQNQAMRGLMDSDVRNLGRLASFVGDMMPFDVGGLLGEMRQTVPKEFDFIREARLQSALRARLGAAGFSDRIVVPRPLLAACSRTLLVMEKLDGLPLSAVLRDGAGGEPARAAARHGVATLIKAYGAMIFGGGLFHADPHSGQMLLMGGGRIGLLDYGQVKALSASRRRGLARIIIAVDDGDPDAIAAEMTAMGLMPGFENEDGEGDDDGSSSNGKSDDGGGRRKKKKKKDGEEEPPPQAPVDPLLAAMLATVVFDTTPLPAAAVNPLDDSGKSLLKLAPVKAFPSDMFQVGRTIMILRGLCAALEMDVSAAKEWRKDALACLRESYEEAEAVAVAAKRLDNGDDEHEDEDEVL